MSERIGIIAGGGQFPHLVAREARDAGFYTAVCGFQEHTDPGLEADADAFVCLHLGQLNKLIDFFREKSITRLCLAGTINKPRALDLRPDFRAVKVMFSLRGKGRGNGDDSLLRAVLGELEAEGFEIISAVEMVPTLRCPAGVLTRQRPDETVWGDVCYGWPIAAAMGRFDIGQCLVVRQGMVTAVECLEGTDAALRRGSELGGAGCVALKTVKPGQEERVDLPSIGLQTIRLLVEQRFACLVVTAEKTLFFDRGEALVLANQHNLCVLALDMKQSEALLQSPLPSFSSLF